MHVVACVRTSFPIMAESHSIVWLDHSLFIPSSIDGHSGGFHLSATVNNAVWTEKQNKCFLSVYFLCFFLKIYLFIYFWRCWVFVSVRGLSLVAASGVHSSSWCAGLSLSRPFLLRSTGSRRAGSVVVAHGPTCSAACGIFPDQGSNLCPLHRQADSQPLRHQGSPWVSIFSLLGSLVTFTWCHASPPRHCHIFLVLFGGLTSLLFCKSPNGYSGEAAWPNSSPVTQGWRPCLAFRLCEKLGPVRDFQFSAVSRGRTFWFLYVITTSCFFRRIKRLLLISEDTWY